MKRQHHNPISWLVASSLLIGSAAWAAQPLTITNPGFEDPVLADGVLSPTVTGWSAFNGGTIGVLNPSSVNDLTAQAPEGENVGLVISSANEDGLSQSLGTFQADADYALTVKVANTKFTTGFPGYRVQLLAGGTVLNEDDNSQVIAEDAVVTSNISYTYVAGDAGLVGQPLEIRLLSKGLAADEEVAFDDVQLTATLLNPVAVPGGPYLVPIAGSLSLDGNGSLPSDGQTITTWEWDLNINDNGGVFNADVTGATPASITYADLQTTYAMTVGANTIKLRVTDSSAKTSTAEGTVNLAPPIGCQLGVLDLTANGGINPNTGNPWQAGDKYRLAFITSATTNATSADITTYNSFVQGVAAASTTFPDLEKGLWKIVASTAAVNARDNTGTNPSVQTGVAVFLMDGATTIALNNADLWDGISAAVNFDENNVLLNEDRAFTGSNANGTALPAGSAGNQPLGSFGAGLEGVRTGRSDRIGTGWMVNFNASAASLNSVFAMSDPLTIVDLSDNTAPSLVSIVDDQGGGPVDVPEVVVYTVTFDEAMSAGTVDVSDFESAGSAGVTIESVTPTGDPAAYQVIVSTSSAGDLLLQIKAGASLLDLNGNPLNTTSALPDDTIITVEQDITPPTLVSIADNVSGGPIIVTKLSTPSYLITCDEAIKPSSIGTDDFENGGTAGVTINSVSPTGDPAVFQVVVTTSSVGTLVLQIAAGAEIEDLAGNPLDTAAPLPDDITITVNPAPELAGELGVLDVVNANDGINPATGLAWAAGDTYRLVFITSQTTDAQSADIATYNAFVQGVAAASTTYPDLGNGQWKIMGSTLTVDARDNTGTNPNTDGTGVPIFLTDGVRKVADDNADLWNGDIDTAIDIDENGQSFVIPNLFSGGVFTGSFADGTSVGDSGGDVALGVDTTPAEVSGVQTGTNFINNVDPPIPATDGRWFRVWKADWTAQRSAYAISGVLTVQSTAVGNSYGQWAAGPFPSGLPLADPDPTLDFDAGGLETGLEWVLGGDPTDGSDDSGIAPDFDNSDPNNFVFTFKRSDDAQADANTTIAVEYGSDLSGWTTATDGVDGVSIDDTAVPEAGFRTVVVTLPKTLASGGKLFARLNVEVATP